MLLQLTLEEFIYHFAVDHSFSCKKASHVAVFYPLKMHSCLFHRLEGRKRYTLEGENVGVRLMINERVLRHEVQVVSHFLKTFQFYFLRQHGKK